MILAIGDSNMYPACTEQKFKQDRGDNFVPMFAHQANLPLRCWAKNGASNYWIEHHIEYFLNDASWSQDTVLLVGWSSVERQEWPWLSSNISVCLGPYFGVPEAMRPRFHNWKASITENDIQKLNEFWHARIYQCHLTLKKLSIKHLFFTAYQSFHGVNPQQDWHDCFFQPYDVHGDMYHYLKENGIEPLEHDQFHFGHQGHASWAQTLYQYAVSSGIL